MQRNRCLNCTGMGARIGAEYTEADSFGSYWQGDNGNRQCAELFVKDGMIAVETTLGAIGPRYSSARLYVLLPKSGEIAQVTGYAKVDANNEGCNIDLVEAADAGRMDAIQCRPGWRPQSASPVLVTKIVRFKDINGNEYANDLALVRRIAAAPKTISVDDQKRFRNMVEALPSAKFFANEPVTQICSETYWGGLWSDLNNRNNE